jgi:hypothetical protein
MTGSVSFDDAQLQKILAAIDRSKDGVLSWQRFLALAAPVFLGAILGFAFAFLMDWLKTRRENRKLMRERRERELAELSGVMTAIGFDIEALTHTAMQQVLPHHKQSHAAVAAVLAVQSGTMTIQQFDALLHSEFRPMMTRCPDPHFIEIKLFRDLPFVVARDSEHLKLSGWVPAHMRDLRNILSERNKIIDLATLGKEPLDFEMIERQIATQATISDVEVVNTFQLFRRIIVVSKKLETTISRDYKVVVGPKLKVQPPEALKSILAELESLCKAIVPDWPPDEPLPPESTPSVH